MDDQEGREGCGYFLNCSNDRWGVSGQLGGTPGSIKDHFKQDVGRYFEVFYTFFKSMGDRSGINLGSIWE